MTCLKSLSKIPGEPEEIGNQVLFGKIYSATA